MGLYMIEAKRLTRAGDGGEHMQRNSMLTHTYADAGVYEACLDQIRETRLGHSAKSQLAVRGLCASNTTDAAWSILVGDDRMSLVGLLPFAMAAADRVLQSHRIPDSHQPSRTWTNTSLQRPC